jgi:hypothetical protein
VTTTLSADVATVVDQINISARPKDTGDSSRFVAFYDEAPYALGTTPKTIAASKTMDEPGTYALWVSYLKDGSWHWLTPEKEFAVGIATPPIPPKTEKGKAKQGKGKKHRGGR